MSDKVNDTLDVYQTSFPELGAPLRDQVRAWTSQNPVLAKSSIELGGTKHNDTEKFRRRMVRAYLLAHQPLGLAQPGKSVDALREELAVLTKPQLGTRLVKDIAPYVMARGPATA